MFAYYSDYEGAERMDTEALHDKTAVLKFMRTHKPVAAAAGFFTDVVTGETVHDCDWCAYEDGEWEWDDCDTYHVEKYDLKLNPEFVEYALAHMADC